MKKLFIFIFSVFFFLFSIASAQDTIHVPQEYPTIQQGIDAALNGDMVLVDTGTYTENINFLGKAITVASKFILEGDTTFINSTIIDGSQPANPDEGSVVTFMSGEDTTSVICGFTITGGTGLYFSFTRRGGGILCYNAGAKIINNRIVNNHVSNPSDAGGGGIALMPGTSDNWVVIRNNTISGNSALTENDNPFGGGIYTGGNARIEFNVIENNYCHVQSSLGDIHGGGGIHAESLSSNPMDTLILHGNLIKNNMLEGGDEAWGGGMCCGDFFPCPVAFITSNTFENNSIVGADRGWGTGIYFAKVIGEVLVENNAFQGNAAVTTSACGTVIWINQPEIKMKLKSNLISGNLATSGSNYAWAAGIWLWDAENTPISIDGNLIMNNAGNRAGGFYARNSNNFQLVNNVIANNAVTNSGGAIQMFQYYTSGKGPMKNSSEGGLKRQGYLESGSPHPVIANNTIVNNDGGQYGGAVFIGSYDSLCPLLFNNIFWGNQATAGNGEEIYYGGTGTLLVENNLLDTDLIYGSWEGEGNIFADPVFIDPENGNYCIDSCGSPCLASGIDSIYISDSWYYAPHHDIRNFPRPFPGNSSPDMGAYEVDFCVGMKEFRRQNSKLRMDLYPNPTEGMVDCQFGIVDCQYMTLKIYDLYGREVAVVLDGKLPAGEHMVQYDMTGLPQGVYVVELRAEGAGHRAVGKVVKVN